MAKLLREYVSLEYDQKLVKEAREQGKPIMLSERQIKIIEYIQKIGYLQNKSFGSLFPMVSEDTVLNELKGLQDAGIIKKTGVTKSARYIML